MTRADIETVAEPSPAQIEQAASTVEELLGPEAPIYEKLALLGGERNTDS